VNHPIPATVFGLQGPNLVLIVGIVLLLFAAKKIPELFRGLRKSMNEYKRARKAWDDEDDIP
jgi:sec-independent protein translocase protein TatA